MLKRTAKFMGLMACILLSTGALADRSYNNRDDFFDKDSYGFPGHNVNKDSSVQLGPRPFYLVEDMDESPLKQKLLSCEKGPFKKTNFSIGHRGAPLQFPEHTKESYLAAAKMGAGIMECDVTFTKDKQLVCRHSQCDLHTTINILTTQLANKCRQPFSAANAAMLTKIVAV